MQLTRHLPLLLAGLLAAASVNAQNLAACRDLNDSTERLKCYDRVAGRVEPPAAVPTGTADATAATPATGLLAEWWGYESDAMESRYKVLPHYANYVTIRDTNRINRMPTSPAKTGSGNYPANPDPADLKFQLSAKLRVLDLWSSEPESSRPPERNHDFGLWLAYTQQSYWQIFNAPLSRPFLETDYQPEVILAFRPQLFFGKTPSYQGIEWQLLNVGFVHQSNGQSDPLSRSWNRVYAQFGFEKKLNSDGDLAVLVRPWYRIKEQSSKDDNPDINRFFGYGDLTAVYRNGPVLLSLMGLRQPAHRQGRRSARLCVSTVLLQGSRHVSAQGLCAGVQWVRRKVDRLRLAPDDDQRRVYGKPEPLRSRRELSGDAGR